MTKRTQIISGRVSNTQLSLILSRWELGRSCPQRPAGARMGQNARQPPMGPAGACGARPAITLGKFSVSF